MTVSCVDCDRDISRRSSTMVAVHMNKPDGGYDRVRMPACHQCALERRGYECDHCSKLHMDMQGARECCVGSTKAPDCLECGRRMSVAAAGYSPHEGQTITIAECDCCPVMWGRFTGWEMTDDGPCKHVDGTAEKRPSRARSSTEDQ